MTEAPRHPRKRPKVPTAPSLPTEADHTPLSAGRSAAIWDRIKHHKVVQWTLGYLAVAYTLLHGAEMLAGSLGWSHGYLRLFTLVLILGVPVVITLAWYHGARGQQKASGTEIMIIAILVALGGAFLWRDSTDHERAAETAKAAAPAPAPAPLAVPVAPDDRSIAVLPFVDMSAEKNQQYMADGMADEVLNLLAKVPDLRVIARTSSFAFKGKNVEVSEISKRLNVAHVLEGSVRKSGDRLRITAQLIRTTDSTHLWSETYERPLNDVFRIQDEIAGAIAEVLQIKFLGGNLNRRAGGTQNLEAYLLYLRAINEDINSKLSADAAIDYLEKATKLDPSYGSAWAQWGYVVGIKTENGWLASKEGWEQSRQLTQHAIQLSPDLSSAHAHLGYINLYFDWDWAAARREAQRALAISPTSTSGLLIAGILSRTLGRWNEAEQQLREVLVRDPLDSTAVFSLGMTYYLAGRFEDSERLYRQLPELEEGYAWAHEYLAKTVLALGRPEEALAIVQQDVDHESRLMGLPVVLHAAGRRDEADVALQEAIEYWSDRSAYSIAMTYAYFGDNHRAFEWLERAYQQKDVGLPEIVGEHLFKDIAGDPRFKAFLRKMNLPA